MIRIKFSRSIVDLARAKLICHHNISQPYTGSHLPPAALSAVLDVLLTLDFEPRRQAARNREAEMVTSHMRIAFSVPKDREYPRSGYPSEPLLAEAAARQMEEFQRLASDTDVMVNILKSEFSSGLLDQGQRGEVVFRLLISAAYRRAVRKDHPNDSPSHFSKGCKLTTFIRELFSEGYANEILNSRPRQLATVPPLLRLLSKMPLFVSHTSGRWQTTPERLHMLCSPHSSGAWRSFVGLLRISLIF